MNKSILTSSTLVAEVGEAPQVPEAHAVADAGEDELQLVGPVVSPGAVVGARVAQGPGVGGAGGEVFVVDQPATGRGSGDSCRYAKDNNT